MDVKDKVVVVTGGANGIGKALVERFHKEGAKAIAVADLDGAGADAVARAVGGLGFKVDVSREADIVRLIEETEARLGPIALFCSNAGVATGDRDQGNVASSPNEIWERDWGINVMAHVYAARALVPLMKSRGGGYFLHTVSAAGLLSQIGSAVYSVTKHAAMGFAEILAITHKDDNIKVSALCPQAVNTQMYNAGRGENAPGGGAAGVDGVVSPDFVAQCVVEALAEERFLILPHPSVAKYMQNKVNNYDRWIGGMAKLRRSMFAPRP
jgi:NAD(P)-dependent dehydrogenase (short-subunit alcohol dehydrogenase family)